MLRVIAGSAKGTHLATPKWEGTRPMTDKVRGALFNVIGESVVDARVLDLFAGTGAVGIEALSRGATSVDFVDISKKCYKLIQINLRTVDFDDRSKVILDDVRNYLKRTDLKPYDLIFFTPPYAEFDWQLLKQASRFLSDLGILVAEMSSHDPVDEVTTRALGMWQMKEYGDTRVMFM